MLLVGFIFLCLFFLLWIFFLATTAHSFSRLGEMRSLEMLKKNHHRFFYYPVHCFLFKNQTFELLSFSSTLGGNFARLGYAVCALFTFFIMLPLYEGLAIGTLVILFVLVIFLGDFFPRLWAIRNSKQALSFSLGLASFFLYLSLPVSLLFLKLSYLATQAIEKKEGIDPLEEMKEAIVQILQSANVKEKLNATDKKLIESIIKFKERIVREVMVPRVDVFSLPAEESIKNAARGLVVEGYSRIPVYRETIDNIIGVLMFKDILQLYMDCEEQKKDPSLLQAPIDTIAKRVFYTPETKKASHLLQEFRTRQMHMAIVVDEYGGTEGVVTMEDILEEIVGEIADEYDFDENELYTTQPGGSWIVDARMNILDAEDIFGVHIPQEGDYDTIGGYIFHKVGSIPQKGLLIHNEGFDLEILSSSERSVEKVRITPRHMNSEGNS